MNMRGKRAIAVLSLAAATLLAGACATAPHAAGEAAGAADGAPAGVALRAPGVYTAGQLDPAAWTQVAATGVRTVINLRTPAEMTGRDEAAEVQAAGMAYRELPIAGMESVTAANAAALAALLRGADGPVLVHCASGRRANALLSLAGFAPAE